MLTPDNVLHQIAIHEAGHAFGAWTMGFPLRQVSIVPDHSTTPSTGGRVYFDFPRGVASPDQAEMFFRLCGPGAQQRLDGQWRSLIDERGSSADVRLARQLAAKIASNVPEQYEVFEKVRAKAFGVFHNDSAWDATTGLATVLLRHHEIDGKTAERVFDAHFGTVKPEAPTYISRSVTPRAPTVQPLPPQPGAPPPVIDLSAAIVTCLACGCNSHRVAGHRMGPDWDDFQCGFSMCREVFSVPNMDIAVAV